MYLTRVAEVLHVFVVAGDFEDALGDVVERALNVLRDSVADCFELQGELCLGRPDALAGTLYPTGFLRCCLLLVSEGGDDDLLMKMETPEAGRSPPRAPRCC